MIHHGDTENAEHDENQVISLESRMNRRWLMLALLMLIGCSPAAPVVVDHSPPAPADTNFERLSLALAGIRGTEVSLYEGLPSQFWEPQLREQALLEQKTSTIHGHPFYEELLPIQKSDAQQLTALLSAAASFQKYRSGKTCSGYHPDYCVEWKSGDSKTHALVSLECGEVEIFGPQGELHCDFSDTAAKQVKQLLRLYLNNRPQSEPTPESK